MRHRNGAIRWKNSSKTGTPYRLIWSIATIRYEALHDDVMCVQRLWKAREP
nr:MAG TPA: hypothetical protein [Caudoviricetes sp.]